MQKAPFTEGDILPSGVKIKKPASINLIPSDEDSSDDDDSPQVKDYSSQVDDDHYDNSDEEEDVPAPEESLRP